VRIEVGPRELAAGTVSLIRRDSGQRADVALERAVAAVTETLDAAQAAMLAEAQARRDDRTADVSSAAEAKEAAQDGFARVPWREVGPDGEDELAGAGVSVRCLLAPDGGLPGPEGSGDEVAVVGRAY
jgi:prolyl-tRNA synthetase